MNNIENIASSYNSSKEEELLQKNALKHLAIAAAISSSAVNSSEAPRTLASLQAPSHHASSLNSDLKRISFIESSGGKNKHHQITKVGLNAGQTAAGSTGLMPLTIKEAIAHNPQLGQKYGHLLKAPHQEVTKFINNSPEAETEIANQHWQHLGKVFGKDSERKAYAWRNGIAAAKKADVNTIKSHPYVQKFASLKNI